jgi:alkylhydroperoxidase family enzyme
VLVTKSPASTSAQEIDRLRGVGWSDAAIHDAIQVISFFNYINRVADAVGIDSEPEWETAGRAR